MIQWTLYLSSLLRAWRTCVRSETFDRQAFIFFFGGSDKLHRHIFLPTLNLLLDKVCMEKKTDGRIWWRPLQVFPVGTPWYYYSGSAELDNCGEEAARWLPISPTFGASGSAWLWKPTFVGGSIVDRTASFGHLRVVHAPPWLACGSMIKERKRRTKEGGEREHRKEGSMGRCARMEGKKRQETLHHVLLF